MERTVELSKWFGRRAIPAIAGLLVLANVFMIAMLYVTADEQNEFGEELTSSFLVQQFRAIDRRLQQTTKDYAEWEDAYRNLAGSLDVSWAFDEQNFGPTLHSELGIDYVFVIDGDNRTPYGVIKGKRSEAAQEAEFGPALGELATRAREASSGHSTPVSATLFRGDEPVLMSAAVLTPGPTGELDAAQKSRAAVIAFGRTIDPQLLLDTAARYLTNVRVARNQQSVPDGERLMLATLPAWLDAAIVWESPRPGDRLIWRLAPWIGLAAIGFGVMAALVLRHAYLSARAIDESALQVALARDDARRMSYHDGVTGLPNRLSATEHLAGLFRTAQAQLTAQARVSVLFLDLDRFKPINDAFGHAAGDQLLAEIGRRILAHVPRFAHVSRVGGDEFLVILPSDNAEAIRHVCSELIAAARRPIALDACEVHIGLSIGIARAPHDAAEPTELIRKADLAMFQAKRSGRNDFLFFEEAMNEHIRDRPELDRDMRRGLSAGEFTLHYQPRFHTRTLHLAGFEALLRWNHPERGLILPGTFIPLAEETGFIRELGEFALRKACTTLTQWPELTVSVNLSPVQFRNGDLVRVVSDALDLSGLDAGRLELEVTENVLIHDPDVAFDILKGLKAIGVRISIDDFGTGYSALGYLRRFPFDRLKIDRSFIADLHRSDESRAIVQAILGLARALGLAVTAEGVETAEQLAALQAESCDEVQGFHFGQPVSEGNLRHAIERALEPQGALRRAAIRSVIP
ncbi:MAG TPA: bifunctional diguanylate cyclase/phosphodiesterase [Xanthobacteraceae bacterium]|nr:bifunctional diguanylate cyclase/phosphodiesterase [Xanthobacteraceae bacterium]